MPLEKTVANINFDMLNLDGATTDIIGLGSDESDLGWVFAEAAREEGESAALVVLQAIYSFSHRLTILQA